ncbi:MAG: TetR/AcrR family transcriptional regulator [bacterium]|nr:TetR/AcrR family transcriptional regulator [bacterium]
MSSNVLTTREAGGLEGQILRSALDSIVNKGFARTRAADIASAAGTSEPTVFRVVGKKDEILRRVYEAAWSAINEELSRQARLESRPRDSYRELLLAEIERLLYMWWEHEELRKALHLAFLYFRRPEELATADGPYESDEFATFETQIRRLAQGAIDESGSTRSIAVVTTMLMNLLATVILTWSTEHDPDFPAEEARLAAGNLLTGLLESRSLAT